jgi:hypothetical protein
MSRKAKAFDYSVVMKFGSLGKAISHKGQNRQFPTPIQHGFLAGEVRLSKKCQSQSENGNSIACHRS